MHTIRILDYLGLKHSLEAGRCWGYVDHTHVALAIAWFDHVVILEPTHSH